MRRGLTRGEVLVGIFVLLACAAILLPIGLRGIRREREQGDVARMRRVYVGITMYQEDHAGKMPGSLVDLQGFVDLADLKSPFDPEGGTGPHPIEPTLTGAGGTVPFRISDAYIGNYFRLSRAPIKGWAATTRTTGILTNPWLDPMIQIRIDGSAVRVPKGQGFSALFGK